MTWILVAIVAVGFAYMVGDEALSKEIARIPETGRVFERTPTYSTQEMILANKILLKGQLREQGMLMGECGIFKCSKRWNDFMDAEIIKIIGR